VRGEFRAAATSVPGVHICEHLPHMARIMHKTAIVRSMSHKNRLHDSAATETLTGRPSPNGDREEFAPIKQFFPCHAATLSYLWRERRLDVPHAALPFVFHNVVDVPCQGGGFLGSAYDPFQISVDVDNRAYRAGALDSPAELTAARISERRDLLTRLESSPRSLIATSGPAAAFGSATQQMVRFYDKAFDLLSTDRIRRALDVAQESSQTRERYGYGPAPATVGEGGGGGNGAELGYARQMRGQNLLLARRLVEATTRSIPPAPTPRARRRSRFCATSTRRSRSGRRPPFSTSRTECMRSKATRTGSAACRRQSGRWSRGNSIRRT